MIKTAVVILNWNGLDFLKMFLANVVKFSAGPETAVWVADNGSIDGSVEWVGENFDRVRLLRLEKNHGFAGGYNRALGKIEARYYVLLNSDVEVTEGWLDPLTGYMDSNEDAASCQPKILSYKNPGFFEYAGAAGGFIDKYGFTFCRGRIFGNVEKDNGQYDSRAELFWTSGACMMVRAAAFNECGGFDDDFFAHMEEIDLCWRFGHKGYRLACIPDSVVYHVGGGTLPYESSRKTYLNFRNNLFLLYKNLPGRGFHMVLFIRKLLDGLAAMMFAFKGRFITASAVIRAHVSYYRSLRRLREKRARVMEMKTRQSVDPVMNKSLVFEFYFRGRKTFSSLKTFIKST